MMKIEERFFERGNLFCGFRIPIITYTYDKHEQLNKDLIDIIDELDAFYRETKSHTLSKGDGDTLTKSILTHNYDNFNILDRTEYSSVVEFKSFIAYCYKHYIDTYTEWGLDNLWVQCWGNKVGKFDYLSKHCHFGDLTPDCCLSANYFVKAPGHDTYTRYYSPLVMSQGDYVYTQNKEGSLTIFPSFVEHDTTANRSSELYRYTIGMDVYEPTQNQFANQCYVKLID